MIQAPPEPVNNDAIVLTILLAWYLFVYLTCRHVDTKQREKENEQKFFIHCRCGNELVSSGSFISDTYDEDGNNHVRYDCTQCGKKHDFSLDLGPFAHSWETFDEEEAIA